MKYLVIRWLPVLLWAGLIYLLSDIPTLDSGLSLTWDVVLRKMAHAAEFGVLSLLLLRAIGKKSTGAWLVAAVISILYAVTDEVHQRFVPGREGNVWDVVIDSLGVCIGLLVVRRFWLTKEATEPPSSSRLPPR